MENDLISRQAAIDAIEHVTWYHQNRNGQMVSGANSDEHQAWYKAEDVYEAIEAVPSAQPKQHERIFQEIVVEYPSTSTYPEYEGKPYFSIKYVEDGRGYIGYGTYNPEVLSEYMKEYFIPSARPIGQCKPRRCPRKLAGKHADFMMIDEAVAKGADDE